MSHTLRVATYRFRITFGRMWPGYLTLVVLVGLLGGLAIGSLAAARRTQAAFPTYLASTKPSDLFIPTANWQFGPASAGADLSIAHALAHLPLVTHVENEYNLNGQPLGPKGLPTPPPGVAAAADISILNNDGSLDGEFSDQDRLTPLEGRLANPHRANEFVVSPIVAQALEIHVGQSVPIGFYTDAQTTLPGYGTSTSFKVKPYLSVKMKLVGIVAFNNQVVTDSLGALEGAQIVYTPALTRELLNCCITSTTSYLRLRGGTASVPAVEREVDRVAGGMGAPFFGLLSGTDVAERAIKPESIAIGVFGGIAALAALLIAGQAIGRQVRFGREERRTLRALGADPAMTMGDGLVGLALAIVAGSLLAVGVAVGLSPLAPIGVVRPVYPDRGVAVDWLVLGVGFVVLVVVLAGLALVTAYRQAPHRIDVGPGHESGRQSNVVRSAGGSGLPPSAVEGIRFALDPGAGHDRVPVRSAMLGATLALAVIIATVTFGTSLDSLVSHPQLYGWNWNYELTGGGGIAPVPKQLADRLLRHDPSVSAWSDVDFGGATLSGQVVPVLGQRVGASVGPPILSGHALSGTNQVVLGGATLAALHKRLGDTISVHITNAKPTRLEIVGTATMPVIGAQFAQQHSTMGTGALVSSSLIPTSDFNPNDVSPAGPSAMLVRLRPGASPAEGVQSLERIANKLTLPMNYGVTVLSVQRPAEIINYRSMGTIPAVLGLGLAVGAVITLGLTLVASVRRRRRDLAVLKTLGFTGGQLASTVMWQSSLAVAIGTVVGVPLGIVLGRSLWDVFAHEINAVPAPTVPALTVALIAVGALVLANLVAALPGRTAARTPTALLLRAE